VGREQTADVAARTAHGEVTTALTTAHGVVSSVDEAVKTGHETMNSLLVAVTTAREAEGSVDEPVRTCYEAMNSVLGAMTTGYGVVTTGHGVEGSVGLPSFASVPGAAPRSALFSRP
jgi:hypothetical protein